MMTTYYVIESDEAPFLRWSNADGWTKGGDFTRFSHADRAMCDLPIGGHWLLVRQYIPEE